MTRLFQIAALLCMGVLAANGAPLKVSALHPLIADLARQVGGERVEVFDLMGEGGNAHHFAPRPADLRHLRESSVILASGKGLEPYLDGLKDSLGSASIIDVGHTIPSLNVGSDSVYAKCLHHGHGHDHGHGSLDPHWWQSVSNMKRAVRIVSKAFIEKDPEAAATYQANARAYGAKLDELKRWAKTQLGKVPRDRRKLVTAHNAFGYFANEFGYQVIAVSGLSKEQNNTPQQLAETIQAVRDSGVAALFPETGSSDKAIRAVASATGIHVGPALIADGIGAGGDNGFEAMIRHNVNAITQALATR